MIQKFNLHQRMLYHKKLFLLEHKNSNNDGDFIIKETLNDITEKLNEIIDVLNHNSLTNPHEEPTQPIVALKPSHKHTEAEREAIAHFVNPGETCLSISATNVLTASDEVRGFDVVLVKRIDSDTPFFQAVADRAIEISGKRSIIGIHESRQTDWNMYMARVPFHWEHYELESEKEMAYYIIDKLEGQ